MVLELLQQEIDQREALQREVFDLLFDHLLYCRITSPNNLDVRRVIGKNIDDEIPHVDTPDALNFPDYFAKNGKDFNSSLLVNVSSRLGNTNKIELSDHNAKYTTALIPTEVTRTYLPRFIGGQRTKYSQLNTRPLFPQCEATVLVHANIINSTEIISEERLAQMRQYERPSITTFCTYLEFRDLNSAVRLKSHLDDPEKTIATIDYINHLITNDIYVFPGRDYPI